ncbi:MAG: hypothetical protein GXP54_11455 [Deltaproteobacteria bacterium]|nr:hypothetical protein [Deltaproteobacteria bacterium]
MTSFASKKEFFGGLAMLVGFVMVFGLMLLPAFDGENFLNYMDDLYNSISKGSAYFIPDLAEEAAEFDGREVSVTLAMEREDLAQGAATILGKGGVVARATGTDVVVEGDLGAILKHALADSDAMFANEGDKLKKRYGYEGKEALFVWWSALKAMDKDLKRQEMFAEAKFVGTVNSKAVECSYNYYGVTPEKIIDKVFFVIMSLLAYVLYTLWYGFAIMFMFEGWGLRLSH